MPWKENTVEMSREEFVIEVLSGEKSKSALCRKYGISRPTGDKWIRRYLSGETLSNRSRRPFKIANKTDEEIEEKILEYRKAHPAIGAVKIRKILSNKGEIDLPCNSTVNAILKRNNCITKEASMAATPCKRFEKAHPNDMWQADFKGYFTMENKARCHPLNIIDDHSRYNLCSDALSGESLETTKGSIERIFCEYGLPKYFLCDNGTPWGTSQSTGFTQFEVWLMELGILTIHSRVRHPQTQGKEESFNRSMKRELLKYTSITDFKDAQVKFNEYRDFYNNERPHHALNLDIPANRYCKSDRKYPSRIKEWEYPTGYELRIIKESGYLTYGRQGYYLSESLAGKRIGIRKSQIPGCINLYYREFKIGQIDVDKRAFTQKRIYLAEGDPRTEL